MLAKYLEITKSSACEPSGFSYITAASKNCGREASERPQKKSQKNRRKKGAHRRTTVGGGKEWTTVDNKGKTNADNSDGRTHWFSLKACVFQY